MKILVVWMAAAMLVGCQQGDERLRDKAKLEGETNATEQIKAEKKYLEDRSAEMEMDLARRQRFYSALSGSFEGTMQGGTVAPFKVRFTFVPSLPPYRSPRVRAPEEVIADLNNLYFNVQVVQWDDVGGTPGVAFGCVFQNVRPDLLTGQVHLAAADCPGLYSISLAENSDLPTGLSGASDRETSLRLASALLEGKESKAQSIKGFRQVTKGPTVFYFAAARVEH